MKYKIYLTNKAKITLNIHIEFLSKVSVPAAIKLQKYIFNNLELLRIYPRIGIKCLNKKLPYEYRKMVIKDKYTLVYFIIKSNIYVDIILDTRQNTTFY